MFEVFSQGNQPAGGPDGGFPTKIGGVSRTTNPTAVVDGARVNASFDDLGRQVITVHQVRDLIFTASADTATLAEVTLLSGTAGAFNDLVELTCANTSGAAVTLGIRETTGGSVTKLIVIPANNTISRDFSVPVPQGTAATTWTIKNEGTGDISGTVISVSALFVRNV